MFKAVGRRTLAKRLMSCRINNVEIQIGGGLIEEVIEVAEGELKLITTISESKV